MSWCCLSESWRSGSPIKIKDWNCPRPIFILLTWPIKLCFNRQYYRSAQDIFITVYCETFPRIWNAASRHDKHVMLHVSDKSNTRCGHCPRWLHQPVTLGRNINEIEVLLGASQCSCHSPVQLSDWQIGPSWQGAGAHCVSGLQNRKMSSSTSSFVVWMCRQIVILELFW